MPPTVRDADVESLAHAVRLLRMGRIVVFPTETVYGLGGDTFCPRALDAIYALKRRPIDNPLIAHVSNVAQARRVVEHWDERADSLALEFWPGPLTLIMGKNIDVPSEATAGLDTIAVRCPDHPVAQDLLGLFDGPISAPSANISGHVSPTCASHVTKDFADSDVLVLDGGSCAIGIESTVLTLTSDTPCILRSGSVQAADIYRVIGEVEESRASVQGESPGTSAQHYAPRIPALLVDRTELKSTFQAQRQPCAVLCFTTQVIPPPHVAVSLPDDPAEYARHMYASLRAAEELEVQRILIESPPPEPAWNAVRDRLIRATSSHPDVSPAE